MSIAGDKVYLKKIELSDTEFIIRWRNQDFVRSKFLNQDLFTKKNHMHWLEDNIATRKAVQFIIVLKESDTPIGAVYIRDIDSKNKKGEFGIFIGEKQYTGLGIGTEVAKLMIEYAFTQLNLNKLFLRVLSTNISAIRSYQKAGFQLEGYFKEDVCLDSIFFDIIFMGILKEKENTN